MGSLFDTTTRALEKSLDLYLTRHNVIADNIANAETPGYKARRVDFENELKSAVAAEDSGVGGVEIESVKPNVYQDAESELGNDLNTVEWTGKWLR